MKNVLVRYRWKSREKRLNNFLHVQISARYDNSVMLGVYLFDLLKYPEADHILEDDVFIP